VLQKVDQLAWIELPEIELRHGLGVGSLDLVDAAIRTVPVGVWVGMRGALVVEVAEIERAVRREAEIGCAEPGVAAIE